MGVDDALGTRATRRRSGGDPIDTSVQLTTEFIPLAALLKLAVVVGSGGEAKLLIQDGLVLVNGVPDTRRRAKIRPGDEVVVAVDPRIRIVVEAAPAEPTEEA